MASHTIQQKGDNPETSSEDYRYDDYGSRDDIQERKDKSPKIEKNVRRLTVSETSDKVIEDKRKGKSPKIEKNVT